MNPPTNLDKCSVCDLEVMVILDSDNEKNGMQLSAVFWESELTHFEE